MNRIHDIFDSAAPEVYQIKPAPAAWREARPITGEMLLHSPSGDLFGMTQNAGMGWNPAEAGRKQFLILSTQGGLRASTANPSRWVIILAIGKSVCSCRPQRKNFAG